jgi:tetratricopeptide (TPR) repeat protein
MIRPLVPVLLLALLFTAQGCASDGPSAEERTRAVENFTEQAQLYYQMEDLDRANAQCIKGLALDPKNLKLRLIQAWTLLRRGTLPDVQQAESVFRELQSSGDFRAVLGLATALERKGVAYVETSEKIKSGKQVTEAADPEKRIKDLEDAGLKAWNESLEQYEKSIGMHKSDAEALNGLVRIETLLGHKEKALEWCARLIEVNQENIEFWEKRTQSKDLTQRDEDEYRRILRQFKKLQAATHMHAAELQDDLNHDDEALAHLDEARKFEPDRADLYSRSAQIRKDLGKYKEAIADLDQYIALSKLPYEHPDIQRAWRLRQECEQAQRSGKR